MKKINLSDLYCYFSDEQYEFYADFDDRSVVIRPVMSKKAYKRRIRDKDDPHQDNIDKVYWIVKNNYDYEADRKKRRKNGITWC